MTTLKEELGSEYEGIAGEIVSEFETEIVDAVATTAALNQLIREALKRRHNLTDVQLEAALNPGPDVPVDQYHPAYDEFYRLLTDICKDVVLRIADRLITALTEEQESAIPTQRQQDRENGSLL